MSEPKVPSALDRGGFLFRLALWAGILAAAVELTLLLVRRFAFRELLFVGRDVWWTVPLVDLVLFLGIAVVLFVAGRFWRRLPWWQVGLWVFAFLAVASVLYSFPSIHRLAMVLLSAGIATTVVRFARARPEPFGRMVARTSPWLLLAVVMAGAAIRGSAIIAERRSLGSLPEAQGAPNVLLIVLDTVRAVDLGLYGYERPTTPRLAEWVKRGVVYRTAFSAAPWTLPSHASMFTGRLTHEMTADWMIPLDDRYPTLAEVLASRGYATAGFSANTDYVSAEVGLARGFAHFDDYSLTPGLILRSASLGRAVGRNPLVRRIFGLEQLLGRKNAPDISTAFLDWTEGRRGTPWFAVLNYYDAHRPYQPPEPFYSMFATGETRPDPRFRQDENPENP